MTENANPQHRPAEPARHMLREWLIDALALVVGASAVLYYQPEGFIDGLIVFVGAYTLTHSLQRLNWKWLAGICELLLIFLAPVSIWAPL